MAPDTQNIENIQDPNLAQTMILAKPAANENISMPAVAELSSITLQFETADAEISKDGDDLTFLFADGSSITITDYFIAYNVDTAPSFVIQQIQDGNSLDVVTVAAADFLLAVSPDAAAGLATAAGPAAGAAATGRSRPGTDGVDALVDGPADPIGELSKPGAIVDPEAPNLTLEPAPAGTLLGGGTTPPLEPSNPIPPTPPTPPVQNPNPEYREVNELSGANWTADLAGLDNASFGNITNISAGLHGNLIFDANGQARFEANDLSDLVPGQILEDTFTITRTDANGNVTTQEVTVKITGNNLNSDTVNIDTFDGNATTDLFAKDSNGDASNLTIKNSTLDLGEKSDNLTVKSMTGGVIDTGADNDTINIQNMTGGYITSGDGDDTIKIGSVGGGSTSAQVNGGAGDDTITVGNVLMNGWVYGGTGDDKITAGKVDGGVIESDRSIDQEIGNDKITTGELIGGHIRAGVGNDELIINGDVTDRSNIQTGSQNIKTDIQSGFLTDTNDDDKLTINGNVGTSSQVFTGTGDDEITITGNVTGNVVINTGIDYTDKYDGADDDKLTIQGNVENSRIYTRDGADTINIIGNVSGTSVIEAGYGDDIITVGGDLSGMIYGNSRSIHTDEGKDKVTIEGSVIAKGLINSGAGDDEIHIKGDVIGTSLSYDRAEINAGLGNNTVLVDGLMNTGMVSAGAGNDKLTFEKGVANSSVNAGDGNNELHFKGGVNSSSISAGSGDDKVTIDNGFTYTTKNSSANMSVGNGDNTIVVNGGVLGVAGKVVIKSGTGVDNITLNGNVENATITTGTGHDILNINGNLTKSTVTLEDTANLNIAGDDQMTVSGDVFRTTINAGAGDDILTFKGKFEGAVDNSGSRSTVSAGLGNDSLYFEKGMTNASANGEDGNDRIRIDGDITHLKNATGSDNGTTTVFGGLGNDYIEINGNLGSFADMDTNKSISVQVTGDNASTGSGNDTIHINATLNSNNVLEGGNLYRAEVKGGGGNDNISIDGNIYNSNVYGDALFANEGDPGDDVIYIGGTINNSEINGGKGTDTIIFGSYNDMININKDGSISRSIDGVKEVGQKITNFEIVNGGDGDDMIDAMAYSNGMTLMGGAGKDTIKGSSGDDIIFGGAGSDTLMGGAGNDKFVWSLSDITDGAVDTIRGFSYGDMLQFDKGISVSGVTQNKNTNSWEITLTTDNATQTVVFESSTLNDVEAAINALMSQNS